jgi:hypothetical protein
MLVNLPSRSGFCTRNRHDGMLMKLAGKANSSTR